MKRDNELLQMKLKESPKPIGYKHPTNIFLTIVALKWKFSHFKINNDTSEKLILLELSKIKLLSLSEIKELFPGSRIIKEKYFGLTKSLIVVKK